MRHLQVVKRTVRKTAASVGKHQIGRQSFLCTIFLNVPLNNALAAVDPASSSAASVWGNYLKNWTVWNHVRTIASSIASALYMMAIAAK
jgi:uncharacterized membrane protein